MIHTDYCTENNIDLMDLYLMSGAMGQNTFLIDFTKKQIIFKNIDLQKVGTYSKNRQQFKRRNRLRL